MALLTGWSDRNDPRFRALARLALDQGVSIAEALIAEGAVTRRDVALALADALGADAIDLDAEPIVPEVNRIHWQRFVGSGCLTARRADETRVLVVAPRGFEVDRLIAASDRLAAMHLTVVIAAPDAFDRFLRRWALRYWAGHAVYFLRHDDPEASSSRRRHMVRTGLATLLAILAFALALFAGSDAMSYVAGITASLIFLGWIIARLVMISVEPEPPARRSLTTAELPVYTVISTLYREANVAADLVAALTALDYPAAKLDIKIVLEADDHETRRAIEAARPGPAFEIILAPRVGPRTKPKALMLALPFARGRHVVVYDAEDRPHPGQLREAAETFAGADVRLGCLQAPLTINPLRPSGRPTWLTNLFVAEYDALFRVVLPALVHWNVPVPLGGTSNHFRIEALHQTGAWDPYNVTEDADLGFRLARHGWATGMLSLPTEEEAPETLSGWIGQRTRWFKGWLQTTAVLVRNPVLIHNQIGTGGVMAILATTAGSLASALLHLVCLVALAFTVFRHGWSAPALLAGLVAGLGYAGAIAVAAAGLRRAGRAHLTPWLVLVPFQWVLMSLAAIRAAIDLALRPYHWEKTHHGRMPGAAGSPAPDMDDHRIRR